MNFVKKKKSKFTGPDSNIVQTTLLGKAINFDLVRPIVYQFLWKAGIVVFSSRVEEQLGFGATNLSNISYL